MNLPFPTFETLGTDENKRLAGLPTIRALYVGRDDRLKGKTCLLKEGEHDTTVYVQFDDLNLPEQLGFGWHKFCASVFRILKDQK